MHALLFGLLLTVVPIDSTDAQNSCGEILPVRAELPVGSLAQARRSWTTEKSAPRDSLRAAIAQLRRARTCFRSLPPSEIENPSTEVVQSLYWQSFVHAALQEFPKALESFDNALAYLHQNVPDSSAEGVRAKWLPILHQDRGYLHFLLGNLSASIEHYLKAYQATSETIPGKRIQFLVDLGILHQRVQDYRSARRYFQRAERHLQTHPDTLSFDTQLRSRLRHTQADVLLEQTLNTHFERDSLRRAADLARRGRSLTPHTSERHTRMAIPLSESLGYLGLFEDAYRLNREVRQYARTHDDARFQTLALLKLGALHMQTGRWAQADSTLMQALSLAEELRDLEFQRRTLRDLGRLHELQEHWAKAETFYREAMGVVETYRESLTASQWSMTAFAQWRDVHRGLVRVLLAQKRPREALLALDRSRARHLQDLRTQARVSSQLPPKDRARLDSLSETLTDVRNRLGAASLSDSAKADLRTQETALMAARQQLLQLDSDPDRPSLDAITETLTRTDRALVSYFLDDPWPVYDRSPRSVAFVLTGDSLRTVPLPGLTQDSVDTHVKACSPLFTSQGKPDRANAMHFDLRPLHQLHEAVYAPVAEHLPDDRSLTVVPDGPLFYLPFSMLVDSMPGGRYAPSEARFVLHDRPIALELASSLVADPVHQNVEWSRFAPQLAAYGVSDFDTLRTVPSALRTAIPDALSDSPLALPPLPGVERELHALQSTVPDARLALNEQASERAFCRSARSAGVLHVASHAFVNASSPLQNAILLRPERRGGGPSGRGSTSNEDSSGADDGILFLHELQGLQTRIPMVVLSGCSTASGTLRGGEGMEGLQYAFRAMGAQSTVSTLWPVSDQASVELMDGFYRHLQDGHPKDVALRQAQLDFLEAHPQKASPFFWAPPVLYGSPVALPLDDPLLPAWAWWCIALGGLFFVLLFGWWIWTRYSPTLRSSPSP